MLSERADRTDRIVCDHIPSLPTLSTGLQNSNMTTRYMAGAFKIAGLHLDVYCMRFIRNTCSLDFLFCLGNFTQAQLAQNATALCKQRRSESRQIIKAFLFSFLPFANVCIYFRKTRQFSSNVSERLHY